MRVLVIKDKELSSDVVERVLLEEGYAIDTAYDIKEGEYFAENVDYDLIIINIISATEENFNICHALRSKKVITPILMLTSRGDVRNRVKGLDAGANDYLIKPFALEELRARVHALLRREGFPKTTKLRVGNLVMDLSTHKVSRGKRQIELTNKEFLILEYFMHNPNIVITRTMIEEHIWGIEYDSESNLVDVYIRRLRGKLNKGSKSSIIQTVRGVGYRLRA